MLTDKQRKLIQEGFDVGFTDRHIANAIGDITHRQVFNYRVKLGIASSDVLNRRYDVWNHLIYAGMPIQHIAKVYEVTEDTIKVQLWKHKKLSLIDAKLHIDSMRQLTAEAVDGSAIPNFSKYGLPASLLRKNAK